MKKRTFLLLEIIIAFFLVTLCVVPLVSAPLKYFRMQNKRLENLEMGRLADWTFSEVALLFLNQEIHWEEIPERQEKSNLIDLPDATIQIPNAFKKKVRRSFCIETAGEKLEEKKGLLSKTLNITIWLNQKPYKYRMPVTCKTMLPPKSAS